MLFRPRHEKIFFGLKEFPLTPGAIPKGKDSTFVGDVISNTSSEQYRGKALNEEAEALLLSSAIRHRWWV